MAPDLFDGESRRVRFALVRDAPGPARRTEAWSDGILCGLDLRDARGARVPDPPPGFARVIEVVTG